MSLHPLAQLGQVALALGLGAALGLLFDVPVSYTHLTLPTKLEV